MDRIRKGTTACLLAAWAATAWAATAHAEYFTYSDAVIFNTSSASGATASGSTITYADGNSITLTPNTVAGMPYLDGQGAGTDIVLGGISVAAGNGPFLSDSVAATYTFTLTLTAYASPSATASDGTETFTITGTLGGSLGGFAANISNTYGPVMPPAAGQFAVTAPASDYTAPGPRTSGSFGAHVQAGFQAAAVPEPSSMALVAGGGLCLILRRRLVRAAA